MLLYNTIRPHSSLGWPPAPETLLPADPACAIWKLQPDRPSVGTRFGAQISADIRDEYRQLFTCVFSDFYLFEDLVGDISIVSRCEMPLVCGMGAFRLWTCRPDKEVASMNVHGVERILTFNVDDFARYGIEVPHPSSVSA
jgi:hypothetical protein